MAENKQRQISQTYAGKIENLISLLNKINEAYQNGEKEYTTTAGVKRPIRVLGNVPTTMAKLKTDLYDELDAIGNYIGKIYENSVKLSKTADKLKEEIRIIKAIPYLSKEEKRGKIQELKTNSKAEIQSAKNSIENSINALKGSLEKINEISYYRIGEGFVFNRGDIKTKPGELAMQLMSEYTYIGTTLTRMLSATKNHDFLKDNQLDESRIGLIEVIKDKYNSLLDGYEYWTELVPGAESEFKKYLGEPRKQTPELMDLHIVKKMPPNIKTKNYRTRLDFINTKTNKFLTEDNVLAFRIYPDTPTEKIPDKEQVYVLDSVWQNMTKDKLPIFEGKIIDETADIPRQWDSPNFKYIIRTLLLKEGYLINTPTNSPKLNPILSEEEKFKIFDKLINENGVPKEKIAQYLEFRKTPPHALEETKIHTFETWQPEVNLLSKVPESDALLKGHFDGISH